MEVVEQLGVVLLHVGEVHLDAVLLAVQVTHQSVPVGEGVPQSKVSEELSKALSGLGSRQFEG